MFRCCSVGVNLGGQVWFVAGSVCVFVFSSVFVVCGVVLVAVLGAHVLWGGGWLWCAWFFSSYLHSFVVCLLFLV